MNGNVGYNPLRYIRYDAERREYDPKDILRVSEIAIQSLSQKEPFWDVSARMYLSSVIAYVLEALPDDEHTFEYVNKVKDSVDTDTYASQFNAVDDYKTILEQCQAAIAANTAGMTLYEVYLQLRQLILAYRHVAQ